MGHQPNPWGPQLATQLRNFQPQHHEIQTPSSRHNRIACVIAICTSRQAQSILDMSMVAGPAKFLPSPLKQLPWQGQLNSLSSGFHYKGSSRWQQAASHHKLLATQLLASILHCVCIKLSALDAQHTLRCSSLRHQNSRVPAAEDALALHPER